MPYVASTLGSYMTGTVTVVNGSTAVTGSGTLWSQIVCEGDILTLDDSKLYFVASVNSDTSLTLDKPYAESSGSGKSYRIILNTAAHFPSDVAAKVERALADLPAMVEDVENSYVPRSWTSSTGGAGKIPIATNEGFISDNFVNGIHKRVYFSQTSGTFTAPYTGVYRITLKGGGGGGGARNKQNRPIGTGGGEGGKLVFYIDLIKNNSYQYVVGAGGSGGVDADENTSYVNATSGGRTSFSTSTYTYYARGGDGGSNASNLTKPGGLGGRGYALGSRHGYFIPGASGQSGGGIGGGGNVDFDFGYALCGGGSGGGNGSSSGAVLGGGGAGSSNAGNAPVAQDGGDGYILIEYAG